MKKIYFTLILSLLINMLFSQNLVVGFFDPNETLSISSGTYIYDTVIVVNNGTLNIHNSNFKVNDMLFITNTAKLNVLQSGFEANGIFACQENSVSVLKDTIQLSCNIIIFNNSSVNIDSSVVEIPMSYKGQYEWIAIDSSSFSVNNTILNLGDGALGGSFNNNSNFKLNNVVFNSNILPITLGLQNQSTSTIDSCYGGLEIILSDSCNLNISSSSFFMIWYRFGYGDTANFSYPPPNSVYPGASDIINYQFPGSSPNISGIDFNFNVQNTTGIFWGLISEKNSDITVNNSTLLGCGFYFKNNSYNIASDFIDDSLYVNFHAPFTDRSFSANNTNVSAWNFYPADSAELVISNCIYGESLGFQKATVRVYNSICDGTGGYFGGLDESKIYVYNSEIIRNQNDPAQIINLGDNCEALLYNSIISGNIVINDSTKLFVGNTIFDSIPVVNDNAIFAEAWTDSIVNASIDTTLIIKGRAWKINGPLNTSSITKYALEFSLPDSTNKQIIKDTVNVSININYGNLALWDTHGLLSGNYLLWLTIYIDGDTAISCNRTINLETNTNIIPSYSLNDIKIYPNPTTGIFTIEGEDIQSIEITNINGQVIYDRNLQGFQNLEGLIQIDLSKQPKGIYFVKVQSKYNISTNKILLIE